MLKSFSHRSGATVKYSNFSAVITAKATKEQAAILDYGASAKKDMSENTTTFRYHIE